MNNEQLFIKGGGALRRLRENNFEALVLVLKIGLGGYFVCLKGGGAYFGIKTLIKDLRLPNDFK